MIISGIGIDIINVNRIRKSIMARPFAEKILSSFEYENTDKKLFGEPLYMSFVFSAKEAVSKAVGTGFVGISYKDINVYFNDKCPYAMINASIKGLNKYKYYLKFERTGNNVTCDAPMIITTCIAYKPGNAEELIFNILNDNEYAYLAKTQIIPIENIDFKKLTEAELCFRHESRAANIAAKEALFNLLGLDNTIANYQKLLILRDASGKPYFYTTDKEINKSLDEYNTYLSLSHEKEVAVAFVLLQAKE